jgi:hypothetical protein
VCPVDCIPINPAHVESQETLWEKYRRLQQAAGLPVSSAPPVPPGA